MSNEIEITVRGNAGSDPTLYEGQNGGVVVRFTVAVSATRRNGEDGTFVTTEPQWFTVKAFGALARNVAQSVAKGTPVLVRGELITEYWRDPEGVEKSSQVLRADSIGIELHNGIAQYTKLVRNSPLAAANEIGPDSVSDAGFEAEELAGSAAPKARKSRGGGEALAGELGEELAAELAAAPF